MEEKVESNSQAIDNKIIENEKELIIKTIEKKEEEVGELFGADLAEKTNNLADYKELLKVKIGSEMLSNYRNINLLPPAELGKRDYDDMSEPSSFKMLNGLVDQIKDITTKKVKVDNYGSIPSYMISGTSRQDGTLMLTENGEAQGSNGKASRQVVLANQSADNSTSNALQLLSQGQRSRVGAIYIDRIKKIVKPTWHAPWKLKRVIAGHHQWVRCVDFDPMNEWFVTGSNDRTIKFWDLASGKLKITLTGHISSVRDVVVDPRHTYIYTCSEDKTVRCWDLVQNKEIRNYHGHLSGVYTLALHPTLNVLASGGRDSTVRIWDIRTKYQVHCLEGHRDTVQSIAMQEFEPQVISGSSDQTIRTWDLAAGKRIKVLTNHKKSIRGLLFHHEEYTFCSGSGDNLKVWKCPEGKFLRNFSGHNAIINSIALNEDNVLVSAGDNGTMFFWDWKSGYNFQQIKSKPQPGSIASEAGIYSAKFDRSGMRLVTCECDKTIKVWEEDEEATPQSHPIDPNFRDFMKGRNQY